MPVFLRVRDGGSFRDVAVLAAEEPLTIGRDQDADLSFPFDTQMSSLHAQVSLQGQVCTVIDLDSTNGMYLNEEPVEQFSLRPGNILRCGSTEFCIEMTEQDETAEATVTTAPVRHHSGTVISGVTEPTVQGGAVAVAPLPAELKQVSGFCAASAIDVYRRFALQKVLSITPDTVESPKEFTIRLLETGADNDCLYFLAYALPKRMGVWWLTQCIRAAGSLKSDGDPAMLEATEAWVKSPTDETRRTAMKLAEKLEMSTPASLAGVSAYFTHGSLGPANTPEIPAPDNVAGKMIGGGAILAAVIHSPEKAPERRRRFVDLALKVSSGALSWKQDK